MVIPLSLVGGAISLLGKLFGGGGKGSGGNAAGGQSPTDFKQVLQIVNLAKQIGDKISPQDKTSIEQALEKGDLNSVLQTLQSVLAQLLNGGGTASATPTATTPTTTASTSPPPTTTPATVPTPVGVSLQQAPRYGLQGITTNGDHGQFLANGTANPITTDAQTYLDSVVGAGKTKPMLSTAGISTYQNTPATVPLNAGSNTGAATQSPSPSASVPNAATVANAATAANTAWGAAPTPGSVAAAVQNAAVAMLQTGAAVNASSLSNTLVQATGTASSVPNGSLQVAMSSPSFGARDGANGAPGSAATGVQALAVDGSAVATIQVGARDTAGSGANSQENFFLMNALRHDLKAGGGTDATDSADASFSSHLGPVLAYQAPALSGAQLDHAVAASIDNQKLINQIMDGVFKAPVQLPHTVTLDLNPAHLGPLNVQVTMHDDGVRVQMMTPHPEVKAALQQSAGDLKVAMSNAGLNLGSFSVDVGQGQGFARFAQQFGSPNRGSQGRAAWNRNQPDDEISPVESFAAPTIRSVQSAMARLGAVNAFA